MTVSTKKLAFFSFSKGSVTVQKSDELSDASQLLRRIQMVKVECRQGTVVAAHFAMTTKCVYKLLLQRSPTHPSIFAPSRTVQGSLASTLLLHPFRMLGTVRPAVGGARFRQLCAS